MVSKRGEMKEWMLARAVPSRKKKNDKGEDAYRPNREQCERRKIKLNLTNPHCIHRGRNESGGVVGGERRGSYAAGVPEDSSFNDICTKRVDARPDTLAWVAAKAHGCLD